MADISAIGEYIKQACALRNISYSQLTHRSGIKRQSIAQWHSGQVTPSREAILTVYNTLRQPSDETGTVPSHILDALAVLELLSLRCCGYCTRQEQEEAEHLATQTPTFIAHLISHQLRPTTRGIMAEVRKMMEREQRRGEQQ